jgi:hypothetical protein
VVKHVKGEEIMLKAIFPWPFFSSTTTPPYMRINQGMMNSHGQGIDKSLWFGYDLKSKPA